MSDRLAGKTAVITGASSGIGLEVARAYLAEGANVVAFSRAGEKLERAVESLGQGVVAVGGDVRNYADNARAVDAAAAEIGGLDIFVGNAAVWDWHTRLVDMPPETLEESYRELFDINVKGYIMGARAAAPALAKRRGTLIYSLSTASMNSNGGGVLYTASKHAGVGIVKQLAYELGPHVRVNGVAIGAALTELRGAASLGLQDKSIQEMAGPWTEGSPRILPMGELTETAAYAPLYVLLGSSDENSTMTGAVIDATCGYATRGAMTANGWGDFDPGNQA